MKCSIEAKKWEAVINTKITVENLDHLGVSSQGYFILKRDMMDKPMTSRALSLSHIYEAIGAIAISISPTSIKSFP